MRIANGIYAGMVIGLGGYIYLLSSDKVIGSFLFSLGLLSVLMFDLDLYTGKVCYRASYKELWNKLALVWLLNLVGVLIMAIITGLFNDNLTEIASIVCQAKLNKPILRELLDSVVCGICIGIGVKGFKSHQGVGKWSMPIMSINILFPVMSVMIFILSGAEHVVANMYYFLVSGNIKGIPVIIINTVGNTLGGVLTFRLLPENN